MIDDADGQNTETRLEEVGRGRLTRRALLGSSAAAVACLAAQPWQLWQQSGSVRATARPLALVYRGRASSPGIPADTARFLRTCAQRFRVEFCGPNPEDLPVSAATLARASLYVQPGGGDDFVAAWQSVKRYTGRLREFIHNGGRYLGICMGGYLAGSGPGYNLLPGTCDDYTKTRGAEIKTERNAVISVHWPTSHGSPTREIFYQDGPYFWLDRRAGARVLARYSNGLIAAMVAPFGNGAVGVSGPHPEANRSWYRLAGLQYRATRSILAANSWTHS
jgi:glutamine amidotransferase-like uncharacterized protein